MRDRLPPRLDRSAGEYLDLAAYQSDFAAHRRAAHGRDSWKFERRQYFEEDDASRDALRRGDWPEALRLLEDDRPELRETAAEDGRIGHTFHRVRVVEEPLTPYVQWELHSLRMQAEYGKRIRVVDAVVLREAESGGPLPEVVVLGGRVLYEVVYSGSGALEGAVRFTDPALIGGWARFVQEAYASGEDVASYFDRRVAGLPPPQLTGS
ncbi:hypothetical protein CUT44_08175 [Streptomyces carminius]|uniref:DUF6879 domain-containing protein n=1 Tax=Streptomyces carminius TaxID=2665496 RepID=A0A2M8M204_9ACTN|nr:DUF6879 family protein [Streptomyces carminius]PJE98236.1 hypothetical protein CUT44_08175 [Streptomyces carminius]